MTVQEALQWIGLVTAWIGYTTYMWVLTKRVAKLEKRFTAISEVYNASWKLIIAEAKRKNEQAKALKKLTDPQSILEDMERGARVREMRDANRTTLPREDAGPPAKVHTPHLRANVKNVRFKNNEQ